MKTKLLIIICILFFSCGNLKVSQVVGTYTFRENGIGTSKIILKADNKFEYHYDIPLIKAYSEGEWSIKKGSINLNSYSSYKSDYINVEEKLSDEESYIQINEIKGNDTIPIGDQWPVIINDGVIHTFTDNEGKTKLDYNLDLKTFEVSYIGLSENNARYTVKNKQAKIFNVYIAPASQNIYFQNEEIKVKRDYLLLNNRKYFKH